MRLDFFQEFLEEYYLAGESPILILQPEREGYKALGWFERDGDTPYEAEPIFEPLTLYSRDSLLPPSFSAQAFTVVVAEILIGAE